MYTILLELLKIIIPAIVSYFVARWSFRQSSPKDKLEMAYDEIYFPLYQLMKEQDEDNIKYTCIYSAAQVYLKKYYKYANKTTLMAYINFKKAIASGQQKCISVSYDKLYDNIYNQNTYLRFQLGYLEPSYFALYQYLPKNKQYRIRNCLYFLVLYGTLIIQSIFGTIAGVTKIVLIIIPICLAIFIADSIFYLSKTLIQYIHLKVGS